MSGKEPRFPRAKPKTRRKPWAVYLLLRDGSPWNFESYVGIVEAWAAAKALQGLSSRGRTWIEHIDQSAHLRRMAVQS
jgi:hypothetical protein